jgi:GNAT superfamily N-acetyltransferase
VTSSRSPGLGLARRIEAAEAALVSDYARAAGRLFPGLGEAVEEVGGGVAAFAGPESPLGRAVGVGLAGPVTAADLDRIEGFYFARGSSVQVDLCPLAHPTLRELLAARGYTLLEFNDVLVRGLGEPPARRSAPASLSVVEVAAGEADLWVRTISRGFAETPGMEEIPDMSGVAAPFARLSAGSCFLASWNGEPAGGGVMAVHDGLAMLFATSTVFEFRNRGVQAALLDARLEAAGRRGCDLASVQTLPGSVSERNVERAGFRLVYTRPTMLRQRPAGH